MTDPAADLELALDAARQAGALVMRWFRTQLEVRHKSPGQPVTDADLAADALLHQILTTARPQYGWLSEETADHPVRLERDRVWLVDPIDGTRSFVAGRPEFSVSIGLVEAGLPILGVVLNPATGEVFWAVRGVGAWGRTKGGAEVPLSVRATERDVVVLASRNEIRSGDLDTVTQASDGGRTWQLEGMGSTAYNLALVAAGAADAFLSLGPKGEWDVCAGALLLEMAGGRATAIDGEAFEYNKPRPDVRGVLATTPPLTQALLSIVSRMQGGPSDSESE